MSLTSFIEQMPKVELHVHLEGSIQPETLLTLAKRNQVTLPADTVEGLRQWYTFRDFSHFIQVYIAISKCICMVEDIEFIAREFLTGQARQNILHSEITYTAYTIYRMTGISFADQLAALNRARDWAAREYGISAGWVIDIPRGGITQEDTILAAEWAISAKDAGVIAFGLGGPEQGYPAALYTEAFDRTRAAGLPSVPHAGETDGANSIWSALNDLGADRIGHGVRCLEDPALVDVLRERQIPLEVNPTSNICLKVFPSMQQHALPRLLEAGLYVTINSDDPPLFNTSLTQEYQTVAATFGYDKPQLSQFALNAVRASLLPAERKQALEAEVTRQLAAL